MEEGVEEKDSRKQCCTYRNSHRSRDTLCCSYQASPLRVIPFDCNGCCIRRSKGLGSMDTERKKVGLCEPFGTELIAVIFTSPVNQHLLLSSPPRPPPTFHPLTPSITHTSDTKANMAAIRTVLTRTAARPLQLRTLASVGGVRAKHTLPDLPYDYNVRH